MLNVHTVTVSITVDTDNPISEEDMREEVGYWADRIDRHLNEIIGELDTEKTYNADRYTDSQPSDFISIEKGWEAYED